MQEAFIVDLIRTPLGRGKMGSSLSEIHPADLGAIPVAALAQRNKLDPKIIDDVIYGCATPVGEQGMNIARIISLLALDKDVPGVQINRMCSSGLQSIEFAQQAIKAGDYDLIIAGGVEHMGRVPMGIDGLPLPMSANQDTTLSSNYLSKYKIKSMGQSAEMIAEQWGFTRDQLDDYSVESHRKAFHAQSSGYFDKEIIAVNTPAGLVSKDEGVRASIDREKMKTLPTPFKDGGVVTAATASQITDGAAAALIASGDALKKYGLKARAKIIKTVVCGLDPELQLTGPIPAVQKLFAKTGLTVNDIDLFEINEAFASVVLATVKDLNIPIEKVNVNGGAIALGHPLGCSGARILATLVNEMERRNVKRGLITMCIGFGQGIASVVELV
ncbi:MAG: thiolase family protein [Candidatus Caenarcaniphilales bacterium]|jgi:acetyl-CoA acetyltransferase family protein|nr:thiolase family protein [Candidatus Caenarcaniphilales bacterium]